MRILVYDISTSAGWAILDGLMSADVVPAILDKGLVANPRKVKEHGEYPWSYQKAADWLADSLLDIAKKNLHLGIETIVIEETNGSKSRFTQKILEFIHKATLDRLAPLGIRVVYVDSSEWRRVLGAVLSKDQKKLNAKLSKAKREAASMGLKVDKKELGIKGKVTKKHVAINWANACWNLDLRAKDDDIADALCVGTAFLRGARLSDGT